MGVKVDPPAPTAGAGSGVIVDDPVNDRAHHEQASWRRHRLALGLVLLTASAAAAQTGQGQPPADTGESIQLSEIAARAADVRALLANLDAAITPGKDVQAILDALPALSDELKARLDQTRTALDANPPLPVLGSSLVQRRAARRPRQSSVTRITNSSTWSGTRGPCCWTISVPTACRAARTSRAAAGASATAPAQSAPRQRGGPSRSPRRRSRSARA